MLPICEITGYKVHLRNVTKRSKGNTAALDYPPLNFFYLTERQTCVGCLVHPTPQPLCCTCIEVGGVQWTPLHYKYNACLWPLKECYLIMLRNVLGVLNNFASCNDDY